MPDSGMNRYIFLARQLPEPYQMINLLVRNAGWEMEEHDHPMFQMIWVTAGTLLLTLQGIESNVRRGQLCVIPPGFRHSLRTVTGYTQLGFDLTEETDRRGIVTLMATHVKQPVLLNRSDMLGVIPMLEDKARQLSIPAKLQMANALDDVLLSSLELLDGETSFRRRLTVVFEQHLSDRLSLEQTADLLSYSPSHLERLSNREFGCGAMELFLRLRINRACSLLLNSDMSVKQISDSLGFGDQAHFSRVFKQRMKTAPSQFRRLHL
ncbi:MAG: AraC family transcriptional regulator [Paenibacillaceae bacterium]|nr:AraC family transcriptional regulator [Paenibacillaceae bacterium]